MSGEGWYLLLSNHGLVFIDVFTDDSLADRMLRHIMDLWYVSHMNLLYVHTLCDGLNAKLRLFYRQISSL